jgi:hypothetical protein
MTLDFGPNMTNDKIDEIMAKSGNARAIERVEFRSVMDVVNMSVKMIVDGRKDKAGGDFEFRGKKFKLTIEREE